MEKPNMMAISTIVILAGSSFILPSLLQVVSAQYGSGGSVPGSIEEQLELAKEKISNAKSAGAYGSGTAMLGTNISETVLFIGILVLYLEQSQACSSIEAELQKKQQHNYFLLFFLFS